jgi:hypothetical protein
VAKALPGVVVHHPYRLHERIADGGADELETAALQRFAERGWRANNDDSKTVGAYHVAMT